MIITWLVWTDPIFIAVLVPGDNPNKVSPYGNVEDNCAGETRNLHKNIDVEVMKYGSVIKLF